MNFVRFGIVTKINRHEAISRSRDAITTSGGWVSNQTFFSNIAATINFEIPAKSIIQLQATLLEHGFKTFAETDYPEEISGDAVGILSLTFVHMNRS